MSHRDGKIRIAINLYLKGDLTLVFSVKIINYLPGKLFKFFNTDILTVQFLKTHLNISIILQYMLRIIKTYL